MKTVKFLFAAALLIAGIGAASTMMTSGEARAAGPTCGGCWPT